MNNTTTKQNEELEIINQEIERQLLEEGQHEGLKEKKGFLTVKFWLTLIIAIIMLSNIIKLFV